MITERMSHQNDRIADIANDISLCLTRIDVLRKALLSAIDNDEDQTEFERRNSLDVFFDAEGLYVDQIRKRVGDIFPCIAELRATTICAQPHSMGGK